MKQLRYHERRIIRSNSSSSVIVYKCDNLEFNLSYVLYEVIALHISSFVQIVIISLDYTIRTETQWTNKKIWYMHPKTDNNKFQVNDSINSKIHYTLLIT